MKMKTVRPFLAVVGMLAASAAFQSCNDNDEYYNEHWYANALVTVKNASDNSVYLQLDDKTTLYPTNLKSSPFGGKEVRALTYFQETEGDKKSYDKAVHVYWLDSILTKSAVPALATAEENKEKYGEDPVEIVKDWVTLAEDGYLTLRFRTTWSNNGKTHYVNLLTGVNAENPYEVEFRQNANGDTQGILADGLVAFNLKDLPDTEGKTVKLKLKWKSFSGDKSTEFDFCSRKSTATTQMDLNDMQLISTLK